MGELKDSGERRRFATGAVRDIQEGKGRCDLLPLDTVCEIFRAAQREVAPLQCLSDFIKDGDAFHLTYALFLEAVAGKEAAVRDFNWENVAGSIADMLLEASIHFEDGALKYGENNWQKGIPVRCYLDSAIRHYLKAMRGDTDEPHRRAFVWNVLCAAWTCRHMRALNTYPRQATQTTSIPMEK